MAIVNLNIGDELVGSTDTDESLDVSIKKTRNFDDITLKEQVETLNYILDEFCSKYKNDVGVVLVHDSDDVQKIQLKINSPKLLKWPH